MLTGLSCLGRENLSLLCRWIGAGSPTMLMIAGEAKVERVASNRRILGSDGKVETFRGSSTKDPRAWASPEGQIDPQTKTLSFWHGDQPVASISVYATHPMSYYGQGQVSADFTGLALTLHEELYHRRSRPAIPRCNAVAAGPPETRDGSTLLAFLSPLAFFRQPPRSEGSPDRPRR